MGLLSELKSDRWVQISEVGVEGNVRELTWAEGRASADQRKLLKGFEASKRSLDNRADKVLGL